jgi:hypothetical protein
VTSGNAADKPRFVVISSYPSAADTWSATAIVTANFAGNPSSGSITAYALCSQ